ncbi:hypothetical protein D3C85_399910 [compost metagenome]
MQAAIGQHAARAAHGQQQALRARIDVDVIHGGNLGRQHARIARHVGAHVAATQGAEARKAQHGIGQGIAAYVAAEIDPPRRRLGRTARSHATAALAPQPVAHRYRIAHAIRVDGAPVGGGGRADQRAAQVTRHPQQQIAALVRIPCPVNAVGAAIDQAFMRTIGVGQHLAVQIARARQVVRVAGRGRHGRHAGRVHAVQAVHAQVAAADEVQVARTRAQHAVAQAGRLVVIRGAGRGAPGEIFLAHGGPVQAGQVDHVARLHAGVGELFRAGLGPHIGYLQHAHAGVASAKLRHGLAELADEFLGDRFARHDADDALALAQLLRRLRPVLHALRRDHDAIHAVMAVRQAQGAVRRMRLHAARVGRVQVGAGHQAHAP